MVTLPAIAMEQLIDLLGSTALADMGSCCPFTVGGWRLYWSRGEWLVYPIDAYHVKAWRGNP